MLSIVNSAAINKRVLIFLPDPDFFFFWGGDKYLDVGWLGHVRALFLIF